MLLGDGLRLPDEPLESFLAALLLQFLPDHVPAGQVVIVEPVTLQDGRKTGSIHTSPRGYMGKPGEAPGCGDHELRAEIHKTFSPCSGTSNFLGLHFPGNQGDKAMLLTVKCFQNSLLQVDWQ